MLLVDYEGFVSLHDQLCSLNGARESRHVRFRKEGPRIHVGYDVERLGIEKQNSILETAHLLIIEHELDLVYGPGVVHKDGGERVVGPA